MCSTLESNFITLWIEGASIITNGDDLYAVELLHVYMNNKDYYDRIDLDKWNDTCPA